MNAPWTRDGKIRADVVRIAPDVSGLVSEVLVHDNQTVQQGEVIFRIDQARYKLALQLADAKLASSQGLHWIWPIAIRSATASSMIRL
jgi:multidrug resistance efflux pump